MPTPSPPPSGIALVVLAAGLGRRFGGTKQLEPVGPDGEVFFDFAIADACAAGVDRVVMIVRRSFAAEVDEHVRARHGDLDLHVVCQDEWTAPHRERPWGTAPAVLCAAAVLDRPFLVVNADDHYGAGVYRALVSVIADEASRVESTSTPTSRPVAAVASYRLETTVPATGAVSRAVCRATGGRLVALEETHGIERTPAGFRSGSGTLLAPDTPVSMNSWAFPTAVLDELDRQWHEFLAVHANDERAELLLPVAVDHLVRDGRLEVRVVPAGDDDVWIGMTNPDDLDEARARLRSRRSGA